MTATWFAIQKWVPICLDRLRCGSWHSAVVAGTFVWRLFLAWLCLTIHMCVECVSIYVLCDIRLYCQYLVVRAQWSRPVHWTFSGLAKSTNQPDVHACMRGRRPNTWDPVLSPPPSSGQWRSLIHPRGAWPFVVVTLLGTKTASFGSDTGSVYDCGDYDDHDFDGDRVGP